MTNRFYLTMICLLTLTVAQAQDVDSLQLEKLNEVVVKGVRAQQDAPYAVTQLKKAELQEFSKTGKELPFLFSQTPGVLAWSENGLGTGTTYMRIRGAGDSRINVTLDGVPLNSPEDQCVFWANMNSYGSLLGSVQVQRGVGSSTNGDGAFGGSISLSSKAAPLSPTGELSASYGPTTPSMWEETFPQVCSGTTLLPTSPTMKPIPTASSMAQQDAPEATMAVSVT